jgi:hypothetical protein
MKIVTDSAADLTKNDVDAYDTGSILFSPRR